jgi:fructose-1,6-bisphosphatase/inositol monophosphatase family enzyme
MNIIDLNKARCLLCALGDFIRDAVLKSRTETQGREFAAVAGVTAADTIYKVDKVSEEAVFAWFEEHWPREWPVELVMEGIGEDQPVTFPKGAAVGKTQFKCILDPIDGTRGLMYDKRSAWVLAAIAPQKGNATRLADTVVAAMTELPTSKQWRADQISAVRGCGRACVIAEAVDVLNGTRKPVQVSPSRATDFKHGFASLAHFFPEGKSLLASLEEKIWSELYGIGHAGSPVIFDDQYISTGGQMYELVMGHDRMNGDLRPFALKKLGFDSSLVCHPYDVCAALIMAEAGCVFESPMGGAVDVPLDTTSAVTWMGYANEDLARQVRPILRRLLKKMF